jgi:hypothetical protein
MISVIKLLAESALWAVSHWEYKPYLLNLKTAVKNVGERQGAVSMAL